MGITLLYKKIRIFFIPFIPVYLFIVYIRKIITKQEKFNIPIICIGNITTGGTGKTPAVIEFAKIFKSMGYHPGIACRGYRGFESKKGAVVTDGTVIYLTPQQSGDEPFLIAKSLKNIPVAVCSNRSKAIHMLINRFKTDLILMDDGFQNASVNKDISAIVIDATYPFGNGLILPAGDLREPTFAIRRSDMIIINKSDLVSAEQLVYLRSEVKRISHGRKIFHSFYENELLYQINNPAAQIQVADIKDKKIFIIAGIANPAALAAAMAKYEPGNVTILTYPDHHAYTQKEIEKFVKKSENFDLVITTEKDYVKMTNFQLNDKFYVLKISLSVNESEIFKDFLKSLLKNN